MSRNLLRRDLLRGSLLLAGAIPLLEATRARGQARPFPKRLVVFYTPNGTIGSEWRPQGSETGFQLGRILQPLEPHRDQLLIFGGLNMPLAEKEGVGSHHTRGIGALLTGRPILEGTFESSGEPNAGWASGISIDQLIAKQLAPPTPFRSLELGVRVVDAEVRGRISYTGASQPLPPIESPYAAFDRVFAGVSNDPAPAEPDQALERLRAKRRSVLDLVGEELQDVRARVGRDDRAKLDAHLDSVRDVERRLAPEPTDTPAAAPKCELPTLGAKLDITKPQNMPQVGQLQMDVLAGALACDLTRIATLQWTFAESNQTFPFLGINQGHHLMSHAGDGETATQEWLIQVGAWYAEQLAYLLDKLASYPEGEGTLLDNTAVLWCSEVNKGNTHSHRDLPFLLAGSCGGFFDTGRFVDYGAAGHPHNDLLVSLANAMDVDITTFGDPDHCTGPLPLG